jgi:hypothetical protein
MAQSLIRNSLESDLRETSVFFIRNLAISSQILKVLWITIFFLEQITKSILDFNMVWVLRFNSSAHLAIANSAHVSLTFCDCAPQM